jgi:hypothetical protein
MSFRDRVGGMDASDRGGWSPPAHAWCQDVDTLADLQLAETRLADAPALVCA